MITDILINNDKYGNYKILKEEKGDNKISNLSQVNIFIGQNNSGKSRFLRGLFLDEEMKFLDDRVDIVSLNKFFNQLKIYLNKNYDSRTTLNKVKALLNNKLENYLFNGFKQPLQINQIEQKFEQVEHLLLNPTFAGYDDEGRRDFEIFRSNFFSRKKDFENNKYRYNEQEISFTSQYIPILRGLRPIDIETPKGNLTQFKFSNFHDNYAYRTAKDYFDKEKYRYRGDLEDNKIFSGLGLYNEIKSLLLSKREEREKVKAFENFLSETFFNEQEVSLIPNIEDDVLHIGIGEEERPIYSLGDGIQSIIILTYPLFINQGKEMLFFIEEPELSLHPGMQRIFLETLLKPEFSTFQYYLTTHSNHFLDLTLDKEKVSVYTFKKQIKDKSETFIIENVDNENTDTLDLIGVRNSSIFLSNCTIWVEGITDRLYIAKYLELYQKHLIKEKKLSETYREDLHYSFIEYSGGNITHWDFENKSNDENIVAKRVRQRIFLVADTDDTLSNPKSQKAIRLKKLKQILGGKNFHQIKGREIENIIAPKIIKQVIADYEKCATNDLQTDSEIKIADYQNVGIGKFIDESFTNLKRKGGYTKTESGTITDKVNFCRKAISYMTSYSDLSIEAKKLTKKAFDFIKSHNQ